MYKTNGKRHYVRIHGQNLAWEQTLPQNAAIDGNGGPIKLSGINGAIEVIARTDGAVTLADTKTLTITLRHSDDGDTWSDLATLVSLTASGGSGAVKADIELGRFVPPSTVKRFCKAVIATTDATVTGSVDVIPTYLAR